MSSFGAGLQARDVPCFAQVDGIRDTGAKLPERVTLLP
jgi:hypothetical protein